MNVRKSADERKQEIIDATLQLADEQGPDRLSIESIAQVVGISQPGVLRHFPTKQDIWEAVTKHLIAIMERRWNKVLSTDETKMVQLHKLVTGQLELIAATPAIPAILLSRELHSHNQVLRNTFAVLMKRLHNNLATLTTEADGLRENMDAADAAFLIIGMIQGLALRWSINGKGFDLAKEGDRLLTLQLEGFAACDKRTDAKRNKS